VDRGLCGIFHAAEPGARDQLAKNIVLARELGAEIITTADEDVVAGLMRVVKEQNATQLLIGKTSHFIPFRRSLFDRLVAQSGDLDIVVVGGKKGSTSRLGSIGPHGTLRCCSMFKRS